MRENMVRIPGGMMLMNTSETQGRQTPAQHVTVNPFWMDRHALTNKQFRQFIHETGYVTRAERAPAAGLHSGTQAKSELMSSAGASGGSDVEAKRWMLIPGANWKHPRGPASSLNGLWNHPVVHVAFEDAQAYADWARKELPTENEWEFAARGGHEGAEFTWGDQYTHTRRALSGGWPGEFSWHQLLEEYDRTSPVGSYLPNGYGLFDMAGNVWEWTIDCYHDGSENEDACCIGEKSHECAHENTVSLRAHAKGRPRKVMNRVSHRYMPSEGLRNNYSAGHTQDVDMFHLGFRCIVRASAI